MCQEGFQASSWLGILTAGLLWTRLWDSSTFTEDVDSLVEQIVQTQDPEAGDVVLGAEDATTIDDVKGELLRLRESAGLEVASGQSAAATEQARIPAFAAPLPSGILVTSEMEQLSSNLLDPANKRVGFCGMVRDFHGKWLSSKSLLSFYLTFIRCYV
jgi:hypothetical protein